MESYLRYSEIRPNQTDPSKTAEEKANLATRVCFIWVDEVGYRNRPTKFRISN